MPEYIEVKLQIRSFGEAAFTVLLAASGNIWTVMSASAQSRRRKDQAAATNSVARGRYAGVTDQADLKIVSCECTDAKTWSQREDTVGKQQDVDDIAEVFEGTLLLNAGSLYSKASLL